MAIRLTFLIHTLSPHIKDLEVVHTRRFFSVANRSLITRICTLWVLCICVIELQFNAFNGGFRCSTGFVVLIVSHFFVGRKCPLSPPQVSNVNCQKQKSFRWVEVIVAEGTLYQLHQFNLFPSRLVNTINHQRTKQNSHKVKVKISCEGNLNLSSVSWKMYQMKE